MMAKDSQRQQQIEEFEKALEDWLNEKDIEKKEELAIVCRILLLTKRTDRLQ